MAKRARLGIIGAGNISDTYLRTAKLFSNLEIVAIADIAPEAARARGAAYGVATMPVEALLAEGTIEAVINLTVPAAHFAVTRAILQAGKHAYSEKPLTLSASDAAKLIREAEKRGLRIGGAPDTFLGAGMQLARRLIDKGTIGKVISGSAAILSHGMEDWHPEPTFFFQPGGGPVLDMGPYYITALVNLLGPVIAVAAMGKTGFGERIVTSQPNAGKRIKVRTPTTYNALLKFAGGAQIQFAASWDVWKHGQTNPIELYGTKGSMVLPDPNFFAGTVAYSENGGSYTAIDSKDGPFGAANFPWQGPFQDANYRMLGVADFVDAIRKKRAPRCSGRLAAHVVEVMEAILKSAEAERFIGIRSSVERPAALPEGLARRLTG